MAVSFKHAFTSAKVDGTDSTLIQPSNWNAEHTLTMGAGKVLGRDSSAGGAVQELAIAVDATQQSMIPPSGSTASRPATAIAGMLRYNTSLSQFEGYYNSVWNQFPSLNASNTFTGSMTLSGSGSSYRFRISSTAGNGKYVVFQSSGSTRWEMGSNSTAETGSLSGADFIIARYDDAGTFLDNPVYIDRTDGSMDVMDGFTIGGSSGPSNTHITGGAGSARTLYFQSNYSSRWAIRANSDAEAGSSLGSNFEVIRYNDAGSAIATPLSINRATGLTTLERLNITGYISSGINVGTDDGTYSSLDVCGSAGQSRVVRYLTGTGGTSPRWEAGVNNTTESGSNAGSDYAINRYTDSGTYVDTPFSINRQNGNIYVLNGLLIYGSGALGYNSGSGGAITQSTSRTTGVTLNKTNGAITLFTAAGSATATTFRVTNSTVAATDVVQLSVKSSTNVYLAFVTAVAAGSFDITFFTTGGTASDAPVINFAVIKAAAS